MIDFRHLIITRFMCDNFIKEDTGIDINTKEWHDLAFDMAKRHLIPTLENQTDKHFTLVFLVNDNFSENDTIDLEWLSGYIDIKVVKLSDFDAYIKSYKSDYLITSRLDYDDHVYNKCVEDIHRMLNTESDVKIVGLNSGITIIDGESDAFIQRREKYEIDKDGFCAPMETLILKKEACKNGYFNIYKLGYHVDAVKNFLITQRAFMKNPYYNIDDIYCPIDYLGKDIYFIWTRHKHSASYLVFNVMHTSKIKVDISEEELKNKFGYIK